MWPNQTQFKYDCIYKLIQKHIVALHCKRWMSTTTNFSHVLHILWLLIRMFQQHEVNNSRCQSSKLNHFNCMQSCSLMLSNEMVINSIFMFSYFSHSMIRNKTVSVNEKWTATLRSEIHRVRFAFKMTIAIEYVLDVCFFNVTRLINQFKTINPKISPNKHSNKF